MPLGNSVEGQVCALCGDKIKDNPAIKDGRLYHDICPEEGQRAIARANETAARFRPLPQKSSS